MEIDPEFFAQSQGLPTTAPKPTHVAEPQPEPPDRLTEFLKQVELDSYLGGAISTAPFVTKAVADAWDEPLTKAYSGSGFAERSDARLAATFEVIRKIFGDEHKAEADEACKIAERMRAEARGLVILET